jgi:hypothetical protein
MKNSFKIGTLALIIAVSFAACKGKGAAGAVKVDTSKKDSTAAVKADSTKKDTTKKDTTKKK